VEVNRRGELEMKTTLLTKYKMALVKAEEAESLGCHAREIKDTIKKLENGEHPTVLNEVWVEYFLTDKG